MKYLVTGGLGFIGSNLVDELVVKGHEVLVVDDLSTGKKEYENKDATYYIDSITDFDKMLEITKNIDCIFHQAAWARVQRSVDDPLGTNKVNIEGTLNLLQAARINKVKRFIFASSSSVYGQQAFSKMNEYMVPNPLHPYAVQKYTGELYCSLYSQLFNIDTICLRYFNVYGKRQIMEGDYALVIGKFLRQKAEKGRLTIFGDGSQTRAYTHIKDVVRANLMASTMAMGKNNHMVFNVGTATETSVNEIAEMVGGEVEHIIPNPRGDFEEKRKCADYGRINEMLGWYPSISIKEGIEALKKDL